METQKYFKSDGKHEYRIRILSSIVIVEIIAILLFQFWPAPQESDSPRQIDFSEDAIALEDIVQTEQQNRPPSPPKPQVPIPEPTDEIIEEDIIELDNLNISEYSDSLSVAVVGSDGDEDEPVSSPQVRPQVVHIVEPTVPDAAQKANIKAEIWVTLLVDTNGRVEEATINEIILYDQQSGEKRTVQGINYGLTESTINAALQWQFRPARNNGDPVKAYSRQVFTYGF
ncbi:hypothetical protein [Fodinibius sp. Rm-B-1B1-1]|uniref:hypothetical protein n=1 Tax=Fodinibius alkaliphilus TaxID=3140241 RepID=UPI0031599B7B